MCNDYGLAASINEIDDAFRKGALPLAFPGGRYNLEPRQDIWPSEVAPVVRRDQDGGGELVQLRWGLASGRPKAPLVINFRSDGRRFEGSRRCLIPASHFFEFTFGGMKPGEKIVVEIEEGKTLIIQLQAIGEPEADGRAKLFFELNGQPRVIRVAVHGRIVAGARRKAEDSDATHIGAPMAGAVSSIAVRKGQRVSPGDALLTLEAMKMETTLGAPGRGVIMEILVAAKDSVGVKDLLVVISQGG